MSDKKIAYIISRFPTLTETFIIREVEEIKRKGIEIEIFSLASVDRQKMIEAGFSELVKDTHYLPYLFSLQTIQSLFYYLTTRTVTISGIIYKIIKTHTGKPGVLIKTLALIPKALTIASILKKRDIRKIHAHWATIPTTIAWLISEINSCEYSFTAHAWDIFKQDVMLGDKIRLARRVITCTKYNKTFLLDKYPGIKPEKIQVIYHGLNLKQFGLRQKNEDSTFTILSIGRLVQKKGFHILLRACAKLIEKDIPFKCEIVYVKGNLEKELFNLHQELQLEEYVHFIPEMPQDMLIDYYYNSDCFVLPSVISDSGDRDGIPNVILEAFAAGLPVISTNVSGIPEVVINNQTGLVVEPNNAEDLANTIEKLYLDEKLRTTLGLKGRQLIEQQFEISTNIDRLLSYIL